MRYAFAGDRKISVAILKFIISKGYKPSALFISDSAKSSHCKELIELSGLTDDLIFRGKSFKDNFEKIQALNLDYIFGIHFPYIIPTEFLELPTIGFLNLHPAYLPYNKGWHTPSWAIIDETPYGATLHFMTEKLDEGNIIHQKEIEVKPSDTAHTLYKRVMKVEEEVFCEAFESLKNLNPKSIQQTHVGTNHSKKDLKNIQEIDLNKSYSGKELVNLLRGLTTNKIEEAAYFKEDGDTYHIQVNISKQ
ncbi:formyltransferase family protein [Mesoflavibacter zeaxanthinifaciens]|uniref:formyltransferase family protein n=1 Tax=Mesoflavibacter zeaxanthinifaciens TaxID=393060 RepID=UPI003A92606E